MAGQSSSTGLFGFWRPWASSTNKYFMSATNGWRRPSTWPWPWRPLWPFLKWWVSGLNDIVHSVEVVRGQPIQLIHVISTSEFLKYQWKDLVFVKIFPSYFGRASKFDWLKNWVWKIWMDQKYKFLGKVK